MDTGFGGQIGGCAEGMRQAPRGRGRQSGQGRAREGPGCARGGGWSSVYQPHSPCWQRDSPGFQASVLRMDIFSGASVCSTWRLLRGECEDDYGLDTRYIIDANTFHSLSVSLLIGSPPLAILASVLQERQLIGETF